MKIYFALLLMAGALLSGCATGKNGVVLDPVGPPIDKSPDASAARGTLVVYSTYEVGADFASRDPNNPEYTDYDILTSEGRLLRRVLNNSGTILQDPMPVELPPGNYKVSAFANGYVHRITVPVVVKNGKTTALHLEGGGFWPDETAFNQTNSVRLSNGLIIGWKAATD